MFIEIEPGRTVNLERVTRINKVDNDATEIFIDLERIISPIPYEVFLSIVKDKEKEYKKEEPAVGWTPVP